MDDLKKFEFTIDDTHNKKRLDVFLNEQLDYSRSQINKAISENHCTVNGKNTKSSYKIQSGDTVSFEVPEDKQVQLQAENIPLDIVYEDDDIIVINKDFGMVVHPSYGHNNGTLVNALLYHCKKLSLGFHEHRPGIVHRLDKDTGGLIVVAKTHEALLGLSQQFKDKTAGRIYNAICYGHIRRQEHLIEDYLIRDPNNRLKYMSTPNSAMGKFAKTHIKSVLQTQVTLCEIELFTGRTHQIRVHMSGMRHPIVNDPIYCSPKMINSLQDTKLKSIIKKQNNMFLFAKQLHITHPRTLEKMKFDLELPNSFKDLIEYMNG